MSDGAVTISGERLRELLSAENRLDRILGEPCEWTEDRDGSWETACGSLMVLLDGTPAKFCGNCGRPIQAKGYFEDQDEEEADADPGD